MRASFYLLSESRSAQLLLVCCRLAEKAFRSGKNVFVCADSANQLHALDDLMWSFSADSFLPHSIVTAGHTAHAPVCLSENWGGAESCEIWINLGHGMAPLLGKGERVLELIKWSEDARAPMRQLYTEYRKHGFEMDYNELR